MGEEDRGGLPDPDPDLSKNWGGLPDLDLDPTRPNFCRDIIPLEISRPYLVHTNFAPCTVNFFFICNCVD